jgi:hypothetical protein
MCLHNQLQKEISAKTIKHRVAGFQAFQIGLLPVWMPDWLNFQPSREDSAWRASTAGSTSLDGGLRGPPQMGRACSTGWFSIARTWKHQLTCKYLFNQSTTRMSQRCRRWAASRAEQETSTAQPRWRHHLDGQSHALTRGSYVGLRRRSGRRRGYINVHL